MPGSSGSFLRQLSGKDAWKSSSKRWGSGRADAYNCHCGDKMEALNHGGLASSAGVRKRVMVVIDDSARARHAMIWALTHVANKGDLLTLLHVVSPVGAGDSAASSSSFSPYLANSLASICKASKPEVEVEALVLQGPKLATVTSQVKKLEVSVLVVGQKKPSGFLNCLCGINGSDDFVEKCINGADCLTIGVRKQSRGMGGYLISTRWQKNFWLLA